MAAIVPNEGEIRALQDIKDQGSTFKIVLVQSNTVPDENTTWAGVTEANYSGYARQTPAWSAIATGGDGRAFMTAPALTFLHNGGATANNIYCWALIYVSGGTEKLRAIERIASPPVVMDSNGDAIVITPRHYLRQQV